MTDKGVDKISRNMHAFETAVEKVVRIRGLIPKERAFAEGESKAGVLSGRKFGDFARDLQSVHGHEGSNNPTGESV